MWICSMGTMSIPHGQHEQGFLRKGRKRGEGGFSAQFSGMFIFSIDSYYMDLSCCKSITKSFVM